MARQFIVPFLLLSVVPVAVVLLFTIAIDSPTPGARQAADSPVEAPQVAKDRS